MIETVYGFDKIRINFLVPLEDLRKKINSKLIRKHCRSFKIKDSHPWAKEWYGYHSTIRMVAPKPKAIKHLKKYIEDLGFYAFAELEIAGDKPYETKNETEYVVQENSKTIVKKWNTMHKIYRQGDYQDNPEEYHKILKKMRADDGSRYGEITIYSGSDRIKFVQYPRLSKYNGKPSVHSEWRYKSKYVIKQKTGIETIEDLLDFDTENFMDKQNEKFITHKKINKAKFGKFLSGVDGRKRNFSKRQQMKIGLATTIFCQAYNINSYPDLALHIRGLQKEVKAKVGRRNSWENKLISLGGNYRKFAAP